MKTYVLLGTVAQMSDVTMLIKCHACLLYLYIYYILAGLTYEQEFVIGIVQLVQEACISMCTPENSLNDIYDKMMRIIGECVQVMGFLDHNLNGKQFYLVKCIFFAIFSFQPSNMLNLDLYLTVLCLKAVVNLNFLPPCKMGGFNLHHWQW